MPIPRSSSTRSSARCRRTRCRRTGRIVAAVAVLLVAAAGCVPARAGPGFTQARAPHRTSITVDNSAPLGFDVARSVQPWNSLVRWELFRPTPLGDRPAGARADVRFEAMTPICRQGDCSRRLPYWVKPPVLRPDGSIATCVIAYDPTWRRGLYGHPDVVAHELGHCLGFRDAPADTNASCTDPYRGVMSYCRFYDGIRSGTSPHVNWWQADDQQMMATAGYR